MPKAQHSSTSCRISRPSRTGLNIQAESATDWTDAYVSDKSRSGASVINDHQGTLHFSVVLAIVSPEDIRVAFFKAVTY